MNSINELKQLSKEDFLKQPGSTEELYQALHNSQSGWIQIERLSDGIKSHGWTAGFGEGISCRVDGPNNWWITSPIKHIDWDKQIFKTKNSTYRFIFKHESTSN